MKFQSGRVLSGLLLATLAMMSLAASAQVSAASKAALKHHIQQSQVVVMNPAVIAAASVPVATAPAPPADGAAGATPDAGVAAAPADSGATPTTGPDAAVPPAAAVVAPPPALMRGRLYFVQLPPQQEAQARALVTEHVAAVAPAQASAVQSFSGVVRQVTNSDVEVQLKPYVLVGQVLKYVAATKKFTGSVAVGVADLLDANGDSTLSAPLKFQAIDSQELKTLDHLSPPFEYFDVSTDAQGTPVTLRIASNFSHEGISVTVPVEPTLMVDVDNDDIRGLGLQTARITVRAVGGTAPPTGSASLSAPGAFLDNNSPEFDQRGVAHAELRSDSPGSVTVSASATGYVSGESKPIHVLWPWQTLFMTVLGGLVGGFVRLGSRIRHGMNLTRFVVALVIAMLTGLIVFVLYVLGVKVLPVKFGVEVGDLFAFGAAALGGWLGSGVLPQLTPAKP